MPPIALTLFFVTETYKKYHCVKFAELQDFIQANLMEAAARQK